MACWGLEPGEAGWKAQRNPLSYDGTQFVFGNWNLLLLKFLYFK